MSDKKFTPKEAALAVLKKAEELYRSSTLAKGEWAKIHSKLKREGYSEESADKIDGAIKAKLQKNMDVPPPAAPMPAAAPAAPAAAPPMGKAEAPMKGHIKLAKFMGRMEHKRGMKAKEMEKAENKSYIPNKISGGKELDTYLDQKGVHMPYSNKKVATAVQSAPMTAERAEAHKQNSKQKLSELKQMPKPKLPG